MLNHKLSCLVLTVRFICSPGLIKSVLRHQSARRLEQLPQPLPALHGFEPSPRSPRSIVAGVILEGSPQGSLAEVKLPDATPHTERACIWREWRCRTLSLLVTWQLPRRLSVCSASQALFGSTIRLGVPVTLHLRHGGIKGGHPRPAGGPTVPRPWIVNGNHMV